MVVFRSFDDPILLKYLEDIITVAIDRDGAMWLPSKGILRQTAISPFLGALYLSDLDKVFDKQPDIFYLRYMDDIIILIKTKRQLKKAKKRLFAILKDLRLEISPRKTRIGELENGFHFLGVKFEVSRNPQTKIQETTVDIHPRSCRRALEKVKALKENAVHPADMQCYLLRWAAWWHHTIRSEKKDLMIFRWVLMVQMACQELSWVGEGLLMGGPVLLALAKSRK
jgi:hypothetical protein